MGRGGKEYYPHSQQPLSNTEFDFSSNHVALKKIKTLKESTFL